MHVVRCFDDEDVTHVEGSVEPERDVDIINTELLLADLQTVENRLEKAKRAAKSQNKEDVALANAIEKVYEALADGTPARAIDLTANERELIYDLHLLTMKPVLYVANVDEDDLDGESEHVSDAARGRRRAERSGRRRGLRLDRVRARRARRRRPAARCWMRSASTNRP